MRFPLFFTLAALVLTTLSACQSPTLQQQRFLQFGTLIDVTLISADSNRTQRVFDEIEDLLKKRHFEWHGWEDGALKRFNLALAQAPEEGVEIPPILAQLVQQSKAYFELSGGLFNPSMGRLIEAWGFHKKDSPDYTLIQDIKKNIPGMHDLKIKEGRAYSLNPYLQLDFGAIAKGLAVQQIADLINQNQIEDFIINAGGDVFAQGQKLGKSWSIAIENPFLEEAKGPLGRLLTTEAVSIFTSGNYRRFYRDSNNTRRHHIINPETGEPSLNISEVTVIHADPTLADIAATTLMLTDTSELKQMAQKLDIQDFLAITEQHELFISRSMMNKIEWLQPHGLKVILL